MSQCFSRVTLRILLVHPLISHRDDFDKEMDVLKTKDNFHERKKLQM